MGTWTDGWNVEKKQPKPRPGDEFGRLFDSLDKDHKNMRTGAVVLPSSEKTLKKK